MEPHEVLGLAPDASIDDVHERFRGLAGMLHPAVGGDASEYVRIQEAYLAFVAERGAALGLPPHALDAEMALARQDPWQLTQRAAEGVSGFGRELLTGIAEVAGVARDHAVREGARYAVTDLAFQAGGGCVAGIVASDLVDYAADDLAMADRDRPPMTFGAYLVAGVLALGMALGGLHLQNPNLDGRLLALHGFFYVLAIVVIPTLLALVGATSDSRSLWVSAALGIGVLFAISPPLPFLVQIHERHLAEEAAAVQ